MIAFLLLQATDLSAVPTDWSKLAPIPYSSAPKMTPALAAFVVGEVAAGRCAVPKPADNHFMISVDVAALVGGDGTIRRTVPHAIDCPSVEQYAAGLVAGLARGNLSVRPGKSDTWYRATIVFDWRG